MKNCFFTLLSSLILEVIKAIHFSLSKASDEFCKFYYEMLFSTAFYAGFNFPSNFLSDQRLLEATFLLSSSLSFLFPLNYLFQILFLCHQECSL